MAVADVFDEEAMGLKFGAEVEAVRVLKGWVMRYHCTAGWPTMTLP